MPQRHLSPFRKRARQFLGQPVYVRASGHLAAGFAALTPAPQRSMLAIAYTGVRRPCICTGCICLTPAERERQKRVFGLVRAVMKAGAAEAH